MVRSPAVAALLEDLGLTGAVVAPNGGGARIWNRDRLRSLPEGSMFGVPGGLLPVLHSRPPWPLGLTRAALDLVLPSSHPVSAVPSIAETVRTRMVPKCSTAESSHCSAVRTRAGPTLSASIHRSAWSSRPATV